LEFLQNKWVIQCLGILALAAVIWLAGPLIAIAGKAPLESELARGLTIAVIVVLWLAYRLIQQIRGGRKDRDLMADLAAAGSESDKSQEQEASREEMETLRRNFEEALGVLKQTRGEGKGGRHFLYELPWYVIIGAPGSGKTTALVNSGLNFPLKERLGVHSVKGVSGTRNCDWMFTDQAVLLDTAGRYTTQDSHQAVDASAWQSFLQLLKKYRPQRPLNGALVAVSVSDLLRQTEEERALHARAVRRRVQELYDLLGVRIPIYVLLTKSDLAAGFADFFADLTQEERAQVWGESFPAETPGGQEDFIARFDSAYDELMGRLHRRTFKRIQEERDIQRRSLILDFPQQMAYLKPLLMKFLQDAFAANRFEQTILLRGAYFTSGTQEGTPIDRVMGVLASAFRLDRQSQPVFSGRGKSFFLTRLLSEVIFPEAELAGVDARLARRKRLLQVAAYGAALSMFLAFIAVWTVSYLRNKAAIAAVEAQAERYRAIDLTPTDSLSNFTALTPRLDALLAARDVFADSGWLMRFGLYQGDKLESAANVAYERLLRDYFLKAIMIRLRERMQGEEGANNDILYQLLRVYLMFAQPDRLDPKVAQPWIGVDWERAFVAQPETLARLNIHLANLFQLRLDPSPTDDAFVAGIRAKLTQVPAELQIYSRFKNDAQLDRSRDFDLKQALGPNGDRAFASADGKDLGAKRIPGLYTAYGYTDLFLQKSLDFVKESVSQNWVLGRSGAIDPAEIARLHESFKGIYLSEYQKAWSDLLAGLRIKPARDINQTVDILDALARPDSPLRGLLEAVERNTSLSRLSSQAADLLAKGASVQAQQLVTDQRTRLLLEAARQAAAANAGAAPDPVRAVENRFEPLNVLVRGGPDKQAPLNSTLAMLGSLHDYDLQVGGAASSGDQALKTAVNRVSGAGSDVQRQAQGEFSRLPEPLKSWLLSLVSFGGRQIFSAAKGQLNDMLKTGVAAPCKTAFNGRYPFVRGGQDATLTDFVRFFAPNGAIDQFFQANLKTFVDTTQPTWKQMSLDNQSLGLSDATIRQFQYAAKIRDAFFPAGAQAPKFQFELKPVSLDNNVKTFRINVEGQETAYSHGPEQSLGFQWPGPSVNLGVRMTFETLDGRQASKLKEGPWALFRVLDESSLQKTAWPERFNVVFRVEGFAAAYEMRAGSVNNPFNLPELQSFRCPESL
jgi:type VI secretion system protein ImpL